MKTTNTAATTATNTERATFAFTAIYFNESGERIGRGYRAANMGEAQATARANVGEGEMLKGVYINPIDHLEEAVGIIVRRTTAHMVEREGGAIQWRLYFAARNPESEDPDIWDCWQEATAALLEAMQSGAPIDEQYHAAYLSLNRYLYSMRAIRLSRTAMRDCYIADIDGDIISVNKGINEIIKNGAQARYFDNDAIAAALDKDENAATERRIMMCARIMQALTPTQKQIAKRIARGYSLRAIAREMGRDESTIREHLRAMRRKAKALFPYD